MRKTPFKKDVGHPAGTITEHKGVKANTTLSVAMSCDSRTHNLQNSGAKCHGPDECA